MNDLLVDPLGRLSVRLSTADGTLGSGFVVATAQAEVLYVLTALHCIEDLPADKPITIDFFDYNQRNFSHSVTATERFFFDKSGGDAYDVAILPVSRAAHKGEIPVSRLSSSIPKNESCRFRGFPDGHGGNKPKDIATESSFPSGVLTELNTTARLEDNETTALANVKGFSGSGLVSETEGQLTLLGIITNYTARFNTFTAHNLSRVNELLALHGHAPLPIEAPVVRTKEEAVEPSFVAQNRESLQQAQALWMNLQPQQALTLVESVRHSVEESNLPAVHRNPLLAQACYLKALTESDLETHDEANTLFIQAYNLHKEKKEYRERAAAAYHDKENLPQAYQVAESLLKEDEENARGWVTMAQLKPDLPVPGSVKASPIFKVGQIAHLAKANEGVSAKALTTIFSDELSNRPILSFLDRSNLYYWDYVAQTAMHHAFQQSGQLISLEKPQDLKNDPLLQYARDLLAFICGRVHGTSFQEREMFRVARFDYCFCQYFLTDDPAAEKRLVEDLYRLFIGEQTSTDPSFLKGTLPVIASMPNRLLEVVAIFLQHRTPQLVIDAVAKVSKPEPAEVQMLLGRAYAMLKQPVEMVQAYRQYLIDVDEIDQYTAANCLAVIHDLLIAGQPTNAIVEWLTDGKTFTSSYISRLLEAFCWSSDNTKQASVKEAADAVKVHWHDLESPLRKALAAIYSDIKEWATAKALWRELIGEGIQETDELRLYLFTLLEEYQEFDELSSRLAYWREHFTPDSMLTWHEVSLYRRLNNYARQAEVAAYGMRHFPGVIEFWVDRIRALHRLGNLDELMPLLDERLLTAKLSADVRMSTAHIYLVHNRADIGQEVCYQVLKENWSNPTIKLAYFSLSTHYKAIYDKPLPTIAQEGMVVRLSAEGKAQLLELTPDELQHNPIAKQVIGLHVNESFRHKKSITDQQVTYFIDQILDKYQGQQALIDDDIKNKPHGLPVQAFEVPANESPERLLEQMKEILGPQETKRHLLVEDAKRDFANYNIGFFELAQGAFGGDPVGAWEYATSNYGDGFPIVSLFLLSNRQPLLKVTHETEFVLDFSSLLTLHRLSEIGLPDLIHKSFVVSQYLIDYVGFELEKATHEQASRMSLGFRNGQFIPFSHPDDLQERRIKFWSSLRDWIQRNCRPDYAWERLAWERQQGEADFEFVFSDRKMFVSSFWDTILLANRSHRLLITDDLFLFTKLPNSFTTPVTTEWYVRGAHPAEYEASLWLELVRLNMRGVTLTGTQLYHAFSGSKLATQNSSDYLKAMYSFAPKYNPDLNNLLGVINFLKNLYADNLLLDYKRRISRTLFQMALPGPKPMPEKLLDLLLKRIDQEFELLGNYGNLVKEDLYHSLAILSHSVNAA